MQSFTYYKHSPINVEKSPRVHQHQRETSKNREKSNIKIDYNVDKLISQIETMKKNFEYEKQLLQSQYLQTTQNKLNQFKKVETELINKNQLIEQLLLQEQLKVVQLTRAMQEKNKVNYDKEKESLRSKIQYLEQQLIENQKSTQIKKTGTVEAATILMIDIISQLQRLIIQTAKVKRLNLSWHDYDLLEVSLQAQRDKAKFLNQLQKIIQNFFKSLEGVQIQSVSPYRVVEENITPRSKQRNDHEQQRFQNYLQQIQMKQETKDTSVQVSFDTMDEEKIIQVAQEKLSIDQQTQTNKQQNHKVMTQTDFIFKEQQKVLQINSETQTEQKEKKQKKLAYKYCQTEKVTSVNQQCQTNTEQTTQEVVKIKENQISYPQNQQTQTEQIKMIPFETQVNINKPSNEISSQTEQITKSLKDNSTDMKIICQQQESQTIQKQFNSSLIQTMVIEMQNNFVQTEQLQDQQGIKQQKEQKEPNQQNQQTFQSDIKKQVVSIEIAEESDDDSGSSFNVNSPTFSTPFASNVNNQDKLIKQKDEYIQRLQAKLVETVQHYEEELNKRANSLKFDIQVKSTQQSLQQLMDDKWEMSFKDKEAEQVYSIGFISFSQQLLNEIMCSLIDDSYKTKLELNTFYCKYYDKDFIENYRADLMFKALHNYEQIISESQLKNQYLNYDMFWIDLISNNCKQLIYITDTNNFNDKRIIDYLITKNKPLTILSFQLEKFDGFISNKDFQQNQEKQFIQLQDDREILKIFLLQLFQGDLQWEPNETQFFQILQQQLGEIADIWDFQVTMKDDDQFDISIQSDTIQLKPIIPYIQSIQYEKGQIIIEVVNKQQIDNVLVNDFNMLVFFQDYMIIERLEQKAKLNKIDGSTIYLTY